MIIGERVQVPKYIKTFWDDQCQMMSDKPPVFLLPTLSSTTPISVCGDSPNQKPTKASGSLADALTKNLD